MTEIVLANAFEDIHPKVDIQARGIRLLGVDVENVITDYKNPNVLPGVAGHMEELLAVAGGLEIVLITNKRRAAFLDRVVLQLPSGVDYINPDEGLGLKKKPSPSMFRYALESTDVSPKEAAHVDDQFKAWWGAKRAGYGTFFWTKPVGQRQHFGVKALRPLEFGLLRPALSVTKNAQEIAAGDY